jgi:hypothetical protein
MRITGLISAQRPGPPKGWTHAGLRVVHLTVQSAQPSAPTLPPPPKGDAAHLTLMMAQVYGATLMPRSQPGAAYGQPSQARKTSVAISA